MVRHDRSACTSITYVQHIIIRVRRHAKSRDTQTLLAYSVGRVIDDSSVDCCFLLHMYFPVVHQIITSWLVCNALMLCCSCTSHKVCDKPQSALEALLYEKGIKVVRTIVPKLLRRQQDSNLRSKMETDFQSVALTARPCLLLLFAIY